ncbi:MULTISPECIES: 3-phosphoserine/phosphohydroxythreonine transaminase [Rhodanobacter]|uniref:3-phosphoserine/phosphohydroxythreonine transaminase n=1 Tax=Rhodanobacter TaxID=75309 RepID=UPI00040D1D6F|nr:MULTISPECIES: 3-phosphoserine/phosphohydroxythreonine transaminase [Rhodanobacter]TAN18247.1 MAG: 3-phosphoserine/phosphohydroxythreonine transaminase [Rhodanobacter sp.]UJJ53288.1 3-phosphoserine/phosphohydroxythreonine transaminase [Rhodanobacter thiooxydans]
MSRVWNFSAGPAALPLAVLERAQRDMLDWNGSGASVMEQSHRGKRFIAMAAQAEADLRELMGIPGDYAVLFLQGGATQHFAQIPMNLAGEGDSADYVVSGHWSAKAVSEAKPYLRVNVAASSEADDYLKLPSREHWRLDPNAAYVHYTPNETIHGVEFHTVPDVGGTVPLVADFSSNILSEPLDVRRFGLVYAGAQKNIGPSGLVLMIVRRDLLQRAGRPMARIFRYAEHAAADSMLNTPNTWGWYVAGLTFQWLKEQGGLGAMAERNRAKAELLYRTIDGSGGYYRNPVELSARSRMNVRFTLHDAALDAAFLQESEAAGLIALKGHKALGGMRASLYNAVPLEAVEALVAFMRDFAQRHG